MAVKIALVALLLACATATNENLGQPSTWGGRPHVHESKGSARRRAAASAAPGDARNGKAYWERLVGTPSKLALATKKEGILPAYKYSMDKFDVRPFQTWLRDHSLIASTPWSQAPAPPLSYVCGVWINVPYKFIFVRNRKTASSTFITAIRKFMLERQMCNITRDPETGKNTGNNCIVRMEPEELAREGHDVDAMWREYLVITTSRNPWARAASGYQFTFDKWHHQRAGCAQPSFMEFCRDPFLMGKLSNMFNCVKGVREGVGTRHEGHWNFDFCHVEPAGACLVDDAGKLVVDFVIRYERLDEDMQAALQAINKRRPPQLPAIEVPAQSWRNRGAAASQLNSSEGSAFVYADKYRKCGAPCVEALSEFFSFDLALFGWERPQRRLAEVEHTTG